MPEEKINESEHHAHEEQFHTENAHEDHAHAKEHDEQYGFKLSKARVWQGISAVLALLVIFLWLNPDFGRANDEKSIIPTANAVANIPSQNNPQQQQPTRLSNVEADDDPVLGEKNAPVTIVSFEDFQCPYCKRAYEQAIQQIKKEYIDAGKVKYIFRDFPLSFHQNAGPAAEASECAHEQCKFWEYHDALYQNQDKLGKDKYIEIAQNLKLDMDKFNQCIDSRKYQQEVQKDFEYGQSIGVSGTPAFFINGLMMVGAQPYEAFKQAIDAELAK